MKLGSPEIHLLFNSPLYMTHLNSALSNKQLELFLSKSLCYQCKTENDTLMHLNNRTYSTYWTAGTEVDMLP